MSSSCCSHEAYINSDRLALAVTGGYLCIVRMLLNHGAAVHDALSIKEANCGALLMIVHAVQLEHEQMRFLLRKSGAVLDTSATGGRALALAIGEGGESMITLLLEAGVNVVNSHTMLPRKLVKISLHKHCDSTRRCFRMSKLQYEKLNYPCGKERRISSPR